MLNVWVKVMNGQGQQANSVGLNVQGKVLTMWARC